MIARTPEKLSFVQRFRVAIAASWSRIEQTWSTRQKRRRLMSFLVSMAVHFVIFIVLALTIAQTIKKTRPLLLSAGIADSESTSLEFSLQNDSMERNSEDSSSAEIAIEVDTRPPALEVGESSTENSNATTLNNTVQIDFGAFAGMPSGGGLGGRTAEFRRGVGQGEGMQASEGAVELGLLWLSQHQNDNGSWSFDHQKGECNGRCRHPGTVGSSTGATGLALLAFLGAGYTHTEGNYQETVRKAIYYLQGQMRYTKFGGDLQEGSMYAHGIATLALCEAFAMTKDEALRPVCQKAVDFIVTAQHKAGGWRYVPGQPGDTTVFGWQFMALRAAQMAGIRVPSPTIELAKMYLDSVQTEQGAYYGYIEAGKEPTPTAVGLLSRMYTGWSRDVSPIRNGCNYLAGLKPSRTDIYFDYYATQVLHHYGDPHWGKWEKSMREFLVRAQEKSGHEKGSWHFADKHGDQGGRLYTTAMSVMILEVYYRYLPIYDSEAIEFPL